MEWLWTWLRQPSTLRVLNLLAGYIGFTIAPDMWEGILAAVIAVYAIIDGLYNKQPRE